MKIRPASRKDASAISSLVKGVAHYFTLSPTGEGAEAFLKTIEPDAIERYIASDEFCYFVGMNDEQLAGVVCMRNNKHLFHLFVDPKFQRKGIASALWQYAYAAAVRAGNNQGFTVNSTPYAVPVYERFSFKAIGARTEMNGIAYVTMHLEPNDALS